MELILIIIYNMSSKYKEATKKWQLENRDKVYANTKRWQEKNKDKLAANTKRWQEKNKERVAANTKRWQEKNKERFMESVKTWQKENRDKLRENERKYRLKKKFNITIEIYDKKFNDQSGLCKICGKSQEKKLAVDHCHSTGKIRDLLCSKCNIGLGHFFDDPEILLKAREYLLSHN
jgi:hypothetical protein